MKPKVVIHSATTLDGKVDGFVPDIGTFYSLVEEFEEDATLAGSNTMIAAGSSDDKPGDTGERGERIIVPDLPILVAVDSRGRIKNWDSWRAAPYWGKCVCLCSKATPKEYLIYLNEKRVEPIITGDDRVDLSKALDLLGERFGVKTLRVDAGGELNGVLFRLGLVDEVSILLHPTLAGEPGTTGFFREPTFVVDRKPLKLKLESFKTLYPDLIWLRYTVPR